MTPAVFDPIRPFEPEELAEVFERLIADEQFKAVASHIFPQIPYEALCSKMKQCTTNLEFQKAFCYPFLQSLMSQASTGHTINTAAIDLNRRHTFVSNHRDIVLDSALLDKLLIDAGSTTTCEIAIGDNLLAAPWIKDLVRVNKSFIVERSAGIREMLASSKRMAEYMHYVIEEKNDNIWIAQREGRAKDSNDRTQPSILKMMAMGGKGSLAERLAQLRIVPLAISYEYDPCDFLKAAEFQLKRDNPEWKKTKQDDVLSMKTGIMGFKGKVHYHCAPCISDYILECGNTMDKADLLNAVAAKIDHDIFLGYRLYANNYVAADILEQGTAHSSNYTAEERTRFEKYLQQQLQKIEVPNKDGAYLTEMMLHMYANPLYNQQKALQQ